MAIERHYFPNYHSNLVILAAGKNGGSLFTFTYPIIGWRMSHDTEAEKKNRRDALFDRPLGAVPVIFEELSDGSNPWVIFDRNTQDWWAIASTLGNGRPSAEQHLEECLEAQKK
jgi:hypothetical protein